jgi:hypothetical protein
MEFSLPAGGLMGKEICEIKVLLKFLSTSPLGGGKPNNLNIELQQSTKAINQSIGIKETRFLGGGE